MRIKKKPNYKQIKKNLNLRVYKSLQTSGNSTILALKKRIKAGKDAKGGSFKPLKDQTLKRKAKRGRRFMFEDEGKMLRAITHETKDNNVLRFYFDDSDENDKAHYNIFTHKRDFFRLSDKEIKKIEDRISDNLINL